MIKAGSFQGNSARALDGRDIRYTQNKANTVVYAFALGWPQQVVMLSSFGTTSATRSGKVAHVEMLGSPEKLHWRQNADGLRIELPQQRPASDFAVVFKLSMA